MFEALHVFEQHEKELNSDQGRNLHEALLRCENDERCAQRMCNELFTSERREKLLEKASVDRKGRAVRYYRVVQKDVFLRALNEGEHSVENNHLEDFDRLLPESKVYNFFQDYADAEDLLSFEEWKQLSLREILERITQDSHAIEEVLREKTNRKITAFVANYCDQRRVEIMHSGSRFMEFSPLLSASVGGSFVERLRDEQVMLEMVISDDKISCLPTGTISREGEKHVFVRHGIKLNEISRVFVDDDQYQQEVVKNIDIPMGNWVVNNLGEVDSLLSKSDIERWRWNEPTDNCLPIGIVEKNKKVSNDFF